MVVRKVKRQVALKSLSLYANKTPGGVEKVPGKIPRSFEHSKPLRTE